MEMCPASTRIHWLRSDLSPPIGAIGGLYCPERGLVSTHHLALTGSPDQLRMIADTLVSELQKWEELTS